MSRYILGSGLNGLIFSFYNPDFELIDVLGKGFEPMPKAMDEIVVLHDNKQNRQLLTDVGIDPVPVEKPILYFYNGKFYPYMPEPVVSDYVKKKLDGREELMDKDRTLAQPNTTFKYLANSVTELYNTLADMSIVRSEPLLSVEEFSFKTFKGEYKYDLLLSTIPAPRFWEYWRGPVPKNLKLYYGGTTFKVCTQPPPDCQRDFALAYYADDRPYHRVIHTGDNYVYQYPGKYDTEDITYLPISFLKTDKHNVPPSNVLFCGRYATWRHWWKIEHTVSLARSRFNWELMCNRQAFFETNFSDLNRDTGELTQDTIYYITCLTSELHEMLRELNWKKWKPGEKPNRLKVLEEYVDALKFFLTIGAIWNFGSDEIFEMFTMKSRTVEAGYYANRREDLPRT